MWIKSLDGLSMVQPSEIFFEKAPGKGEGSDYILTVASPGRWTSIGKCSDEEKAKATIDAFWELVGTEEKMTAQEIAEKFGLEKLEAK